jgi:hypothetical protein
MRRAGAPRAGAGPGARPAAGAARQWHGWLLLNSNARALRAQAVPRSKPGIKRKELQKTAQLEYLRTFYQVCGAHTGGRRGCGAPGRAGAGACSGGAAARRCALPRPAGPGPQAAPAPSPPQVADGVEGDNIVLRLDAATPAAAAERREEARAAARNAAARGALAAAGSWEELTAVLAEHGDDLNYLNVVALAARAGELCPGAAPPPRPGATGVAPSAAAAAGAAAPRPPPPEVDRIAGLVLERASWFQGAHFAAAAWGLASAGLTARGFWRAFCAAAERKVPSLNFPQLAAVLCAVASSE